MYAVHRTDHQTACQWYDRAIEPLAKAVPVTELAAPGHHGDALVSMAVSYWETGDRDRASTSLLAPASSSSSKASPKGCCRPPRSTWPAATSGDEPRLGKAELETPAKTKQVAKADPTPAKQQARNPKRASNSRRRDGVAPAPVRAFAAGGVATCLDLLRTDDVA